MKTLIVLVALVAAGLQGFQALNNDLLLAIGSDSITKEQATYAQNARGLL